MGAEVAAMEEASEVIAQAQAREADALLTAAAAGASGSQVKCDQYQCTSTGGGLYRGHPGTYRDGSGNLSQGANWMDSRGQTFTTVRYRINQKTGWTPASYVGVVNVPSRWQSEGANVPLVSAHSGGVNALLGDGSVRFLRDSTDLLTLARLATRDDGGVVNLDQ